MKRGLSDNRDDIFQKLNLLFFIITCITNINLKTQVHDDYINIMLDYVENFL